MQVHISQGKQKDFFPLKDKKNGEIGLRYYGLDNTPLITCGHDINPLVWIHQLMEANRRNSSRRTYEPRLFNGKSDPAIKKGFGIACLWSTPD